MLYTCHMKSGLKLIVASLVCAATPPILEMISVGGPSKFGDPETGYTMVIWGFVLWPLALILFLIGIKRLLFDNQIR